MNTYPFEIGVCPDVFDKSITSVRVQGAVEEDTIIKAIAKILGDHGAIMAEDGAYCTIIPVNLDAENVRVVTIVTEYR